MTDKSPNILNREAFEREKAGLRLRYPAYVVYGYVVYDNGVFKNVFGDRRALNYYLSTCSAQERETISYFKLSS
jgi:hypothetical protein